MENYCDALKYLEKYLYISKNLNRVDDILKGTCFLGDCCQKKGEYHRAFRLYREYLKLSIENNEPKAISDAYNRLSEMLLNVFHKPKLASKIMDQKAKFLARYSLLSLSCD